jgi:type II secretory pathway component GspD/PulD (secretin)
MKKILIFILFIFIVSVAIGAEQVKTITLDVKDMELTDVLRMIADQSGLNIIASKNVKGVVAINLQDVPVETALDSILKVNNCTYIREKDIIQVYTIPELSQMEQFSKLSTKVFRLQYVRATDLKQAITSLKSSRGVVETEPKTNSIVVTDTIENIRSIEAAIREMDKKLETKVYKLSYAKPQDLQKTLLALIPPTEGDVMIDERTNSLIITASPVLLNKINAVVDNWDKQIPQVLIEAKILQVTLGKSQFLGVDWQYQNPQKHTITVGAHNLPVPTGVTYIDAFKIGVLALEDYQVALRALGTSSDVNLISSPSIVTLDNAEAKILIGSSEPYEVFHFDQFGNINSKEIKFVEVGIKLIVTPKISEEGFITMNIHPEVSSARQGTVTNALAIDTTEASTIMTVKDGYTLVLGGLIKDDKQENIAKIPILGDIPIIKYAFRNTYYTTTKKEIIIFITPRIINPAKVASIDVKKIQQERNEQEKRIEEMQDLMEELKNKHGRN